MSTYRIKRRRHLPLWKCHIPNNSTVLFKKYGNKMFMGKVYSQELRKHMDSYRVCMRIQGSYVSHEYYDFLTLGWSSTEIVFPCELQTLNGNNVWATNDQCKNLTVLNETNENHKTLINWRDNLMPYQRIFYRKEDKKHILMECVVVKVESTHMYIQLYASTQMFYVSIKSKCIEPMITVWPGEKFTVSMCPSYKFYGSIKHHLLQKEHRRNLLLGCKCVVEGLEGRIVECDFTGDFPIFCFAQPPIPDEHYTIARDFSLFRNVKWVRETSIQSIIDGTNILCERVKPIRYQFSLNFKHSRMHEQKINNIVNLFEDDPKLCLHMLLKYSKDDNTEALKPFYGIYYISNVLNNYRIPFEYTSRKDHTLSFKKDMINAKMSFYDENNMEKEKSMLIKRYSYLFNDYSRLGLGIGKKMCNIESDEKKTELIDFSLVGLSRVDHENVKVTLDCTYNGLYFTDIYHYITTCVNANSLALRPIAKYMFPCKFRTIMDGHDYSLDSLNLKTFQTYLSKKFKESYETNNKLYDEKKQIESLMPHQSFIVDRMEREEMSKEHLSDFFNIHVSDDCNYNAICGFTSYEKENSSNGGILALETGWGKTVCIIELIKRSEGKTLIVAPLSLIDQWKSEFTRYAPELSQSEFYGKKKSLDNTVVFTTYGTLRQNTFSITFDRVVFDESHTVKKTNSITAKSCFNVKANNRWLLSATPFDDNLNHIQTQLMMMNIRPFEKSNMSLFPREMPMLALMKRAVFALSKKELNKMGFNPIKHKVLKTEAAPIESNDLIQSLMNHLSNSIRSKEELGYETLNALKNGAFKMQICCTDPTCLPLSAFSERNYEKEMSVTKNELIESLQTNHSVSNEYKKNVVESLQSENDGTCCICLEEITQESNPTITPCLHIFCKDCIHQSLGFTKSCPQCRKRCDKHSLKTLVTSHVNSSVEGETTCFTDILGHSYTIPTKIKSVYDKLKDKVPNKFKYIREYLSEEKQSCVVFSQYPTVLNKLSKYLKSEKVNFNLVDGRTTRKKRKDTFEKFMNGDISTLLLSTKTASVGINLQKGGVVIFMEPMLDYEEKKQSVGRLHRIGQSMDVKVVALCTEKTYETDYNKYAKRARSDFKSINRLYKGSYRKKEERKIKRYLYNVVIN